MRGAAVRPSRHPERRYLGSYWDELRERRGMTWEQVVALSKQRYQEAAAHGLSDKVIRWNKLDNPFMAADACLTIIAEIRKLLHSRQLRIRRVNAHKRNWSERYKHIGPGKAAA